jgi:hypothetical protein
MGDEHDWSFGSMDGEVQLVHPQGAVWRTPKTKLYAVKILAVLFPQGLPVARTAVAQSGNSQE